MKIVIIGDGKVGNALTRRLAKEGHSLTVIDSSPDALRNAMNVADILTINGNGAAMSIQLEAGVDKADLLIAVTSTDEMNLFCCLTAKKLGAKHTIARVRNPEYSEQLFLMQKELGLSMTVNPEQSAAREISRILRFPSALKIDTFAQGRAEIIEIKINEGNPLDGMPIWSLQQKYTVKVLICAVQRDEEVYIPSGDFVLRAGDKLSMTAFPADAVRFCKSIGVFKQKIETVMIVGGGKITYYLTRLLDQMGMEVKIIEINKERCRYLADALPDARIIHGDGTDQDLLLEEGIEHTDAFVAITDNDEENLLVSMYATSKNVEKTITKINRTSLIEVLGGMGIDSVVSPKNLISDKIVRYVRAMQNSYDISSMETLHRMVNNKVEALEFIIKDEIPGLTGKKLMELKIRPNTLIGCITRHGRVIIPGGATTIEKDDSVIIVTTNEGINNLTDILEK
ncbi:MAG: Trk system potassium transporter TrkA [Clostridiales bacterium]|nr:Trk system potassium transporter TrkA [Clostridiales bacterium]